MRQEKKCFVIKEKADSLICIPTWGAMRNMTLNVKGGLFNFSLWISQFQWESKGKSLTEFCLLFNREMNGFIFSVFNPFFFF